MNPLAYICAALGVLAGLAVGTVYNTFFHDPLVAKNAREGYVLESQLTAANALLRKANYDAEFAKEMKKQADDSAALAMADSAKMKETLDAAIAQDTGDDGCVVSPDDRKWLQDH